MPLEFVADKPALVRAIKDASKAVASKALVPIMQAVKIQASSPKSITITGSDYDSFIAADVIIDEKSNTDVIAPGVICCAGAQLAKIVDSLPADVTVHFKVNAKGILAIQAGGAKFAVPTLPADDYPALPIGTLDRVNVWSTSLTAAIASVSDYAASANGVLSGCNLSFKDGHIQSAATDTNIVAVFDQAVGADDSVPALVPAAMAKKFAGIINAQPEGEVEIGISDAFVYFNTEHRILITRLIAGTYPQYEKIMPKREAMPILVNINKAILVDSVTRVKLMADQTCNFIEMEFGEKGITTRAKSGLTGEGEDFIAHTNKEGADIKISLNAVLLLDCLSGISSDNVWLRLEAPLKGILITEDRVDSPAQYLLMPVNPAGKK